MSDNLILFILPKVQDFSKLKLCDILNLDKSSEPVISDSVSQIWNIFWNIEIILNFLVCQKPGICFTIEMDF